MIKTLLLLDTECN